MVVVTTVVKAVNALNVKKYTYILCLVLVKREHRAGRGPEYSPHLVDIWQNTPKY